MAQTKKSEYHNRRKSLKSNGAAWRAVHDKRRGPNMAKSLSSCVVWRDKPYMASDVVMDSPARRVVHWWGTMYSVTALTGKLTRMSLSRIVPCPATKMTHTICPGPECVPDLRLVEEDFFDVKLVADIPSSCCYSEQHLGLAFAFQVVMSPSTIMLFCSLVFFLKSSAI